MKLLAFATVFVVFLDLIDRGHRSCLATASTTRATGKVAIYSSTCRSPAGITTTSAIARRGVV